MKEGWKNKKLIELGKIQTGSTPKSTEKKNFGDFIPFIKPADFSKDGSLNYEHEGLSEIGLKGSRLIDSDSVLMVCIGATIGKVGFSERSISTNQQINTLTPTKDVSPKFIYYQMLTPSFQKEVISSAGQATLPIINKTKWSNLQVVVPLLPEQKRIVAILDEAFEGIDAAIANTLKNLSNARELFESYLNDVFTKKGEGWEETTLGESCDFFNGKAHEKDIDENGSYVVVNSKFISTEGRVIKRTNKQMFPLFENDIVMVMSDVPKGKALAKCYVIEKDNKYSLNQRICCIRSNIFDVDYLYFQLNRNPYLLAFDNKGSQANLRKADILSCPITLPPINEQRMVADNLNTTKEYARELEAIYQQKLDSLNELKQSLLAKAFSGELTADSKSVLKEAVG